MVAPFPEEYRPLRRVEFMQLAELGAFRNERVELLEGVIVPMDAEPEEYRPLRRREFMQLAERGAFDDERVELLDGIIVPMSPPGPPHSSAVDMLNLLFVRALGDKARIRVQNPFAANDISQPEPDLLVAPLRQYQTDHPADAHLVVEISDSSLALDRGKKQRLYALSGIPEYWVVDVRHTRVEVFREPQGEAYRDVRAFVPGDVIVLHRFPELSIDVSAIFSG